MSIIKDFVEKTPSVLGSQVSESALFDNTTGARSRLNSAHFVTSLSFKFLPSFRSQNLLITFQVSLIVAFLLWKSLYRSGYLRASVVFSIHGSVQYVFPPSPTLWQVRLVMRFWCFIMYFQGPFVEDGGVIFVWCGVYLAMMRFFHSRTFAFLKGWYVKAISKKSFNSLGNVRCHPNILRIVVQKFGAYVHYINKWLCDSFSFWHNGHQFGERVM